MVDPLIDAIAAGNTVISTVLDFIIKILIIVFLMELIIAVRKRNESNK